MGDDESETKAAIKEAFANADTDGNGYISKEELWVAFEHLEFSEEDFDLLYQAADQNGDGKISYKEFVDWVFMTEGPPEEDGCDSCAESECEDWPGGESGDEGSDWEDEEEDGEAWNDFGEAWDEEPVVDNADEEVPEPAEEYVQDEAFPPTNESLGKTEGDTASGVVAGASGEWIHLQDYLGEECTLFTDIHSNDVNQGYLGNCWFLAACASVANYPGWVKQMFAQTPEMRPDGLYKVRMYHPGKKAFHYITVTDEVPSNDGEPLFSGPTTSKEMWPCLVEKAFSKFCTNYAATEGGFPVFGMTYLCGGVGEMWQSVGGPDKAWMKWGIGWNGGESEQMEGDRYPGAECWEGDGEELSGKRFWKALTAYSDMSFPMCCSIGEAREEMQGLIAGHAYSLLAVRDVTCGSGRHLKMCKIRNPHGETEWQGKWSDSSDMWEQHPNVAKELRFQPVEDGAFWMSFNDFNRYFDMFSVNKKSMPLEGAHPDKLRSAKARRRESRARLSAGVAAARGE